MQACCKATSRAKASFAQKRDEVNKKFLQAREKRWRERLLLAWRLRMRYNEPMLYLRRLSLISFAVAILLIIGMCHPPMAYFRPMKIAVCTFGIVAACLFWRRGSEWRALLAAAIAIIFNPIWPVYLGRANWRLADCIASLIILTCLQLPKAHKTPEK